MDTNTIELSEQSILDTIKSLIGGLDGSDVFDTDIITHINTSFHRLKQLGVRPKKGFHIKDASTTWGDYLPPCIDMEMVKSYIYLRVRLIFDPPTNSFLVTELRNQMNEYGWCIREEAALIKNWGE